MTFEEEESEKKVAIDPRESHIYPTKGYDKHRVA